MNEGQGAAAPPLPAGADDALGTSAVSAVAEPALTPSATLPEPEAAISDPPDEGGPHVRVDARKLEQALLDVRGPVASLRLVLDGPGVEAARADQQQLLSQIDDYLLPRLRQSGAPILIAMVGSTGAGKSTLLNSVVRKHVSVTGIRRPTTNSPVLACHPDDVGWFAENVFLPSLPRVRQQGLAMPGRDGLLVLATSEGMPNGVALLDTPDIDSVVAAHRQFARQFLDASDLWLFVTTARRYADAAVWDLLKDARDRGASLGIVLSRVPPAATGQLAPHFEAMLAANGLGDVERFVVPETTVEDARLPEDVSEPVRDWLAETARRQERKIAILTQTMSGVLDTFEARVPALAAQAETQLALRDELRSAAEAAYSAGLAELDEATRSGSLLRGEVLARWQDFAGTGELLRTNQPTKGRRTSRRSRRHAASSARAQALRTALRSSIEALIVSLADRAAEDAMERWRASPAGTALLEQAQQDRDEQAQRGESSYQVLRKWEGELDWGFPGEQPGLAASLPEGGVDALARSSAGLASDATRVVASWLDHLLTLVQTENVMKRSIARAASFEPESVALVLTIGVLGYGAGDLLVSEGASATPQRLLTSLFGVGLLRDIGGRARQDLHERVSVLFAAEAARFAVLLDAAGVIEQSAPGELYQASYALESAR
jgi:hypothetical protein